MARRLNWAWMGAIFYLLANVALGEVQQPDSIEMGEYVFTFDQSPNEDKFIDAEFVSTITIKDSRSGNEVLKEVSTLIPGCDPVPKFQKLAGNLIALCGHLGGRHYTYKLFRMRGHNVEVATVASYDNPSKLIIDEQDSISILIALRDLLPERTGPLYFPYVYRLNNDQSAFGFYLDFSSKSRSQYQGYYNAVRDDDDAYFLPVKLAALVATRDDDFICSKINEMVQNRKDLDERKYRQQIAKWLQRLPSIEYPVFDLSTCVDTLPVNSADVGR